MVACASRTPLGSFRHGSNYTTGPSTRSTFWANLPTCVSVWLQGSWSSTTRSEKRRRTIFYMCSCALAIAGSLIVDRNHDHENFHDTSLLPCDGPFSMGKSEAFQKFWTPWTQLTNQRHDRRAIGFSLHSSAYSLATHDSNLKSCALRDSRNGFHSNWICGRVGCQKRHTVR